MVIANCLVFNPYTDDTIGLTCAKCNNGFYLNKNSNECIAPINNC